MFSNKQFDGIILDLGTCSTHLDDSNRGFSFQTNGPLDMRMDTSVGFSASEWLNNASEIEISDILYKYGEEKASRKIASAIIKSREIKPIETTFELSNIIQGVIKRNGKTHPATKSFQAIRIHVNDELNHLKIAFKVRTILEIRRNGSNYFISFS